MKKLLPIILGYIAFLGTSCSVQAMEADATSTAVLVTSTVPSVATAVPSQTPPPPPPQPTSAPVQATSSTQVNARAEPSTVGEILGVIPAGTALEIVGKDPGESWLQILYPQGPDGRAWVTAQYVTVAEGQNIPVVGGDQADSESGNVAIVQQQINVRSGPGTGFNSLGTLNAQDVVSLTGKDANGAWLQIAFSAGPEGKGWVSAAFVQARGVENLPIITEAGQVVGTGTPTGIPATPTPTIIPAWGDGDSQSNPVVNVSFDPSGTNSLIYSGDVSTPNGDTDDWVNFKPYSSGILIRITCSGNGTLHTEILQNGVPLGADVTCGEPWKQIQVSPGAPYSIHLSVEHTSGGLQYAGYTITIQSVP